MEIIIKIIKGCLLTIFVTIFFSCQKDQGVGTVGIAKVNVINAVVAGGNVKVNVSNKRLPWSSIANAQVLGGTNKLNRLYIVPTKMSTYLQVSPISDTTQLWYDQLKQLNEGKMYTLYLSGTPDDITTLIHEEINFPKPIIRDAGRPTPVTDSIVNIRFVNLSPSGPKVDINIQGKSSNEASGVSYEEFTDFKIYSATKEMNYILFEIRNSSDNELIATYPLYVPDVRFKSIAIVILGIYPGIAVPYTDKYRADIMLY